MADWWPENTVNKGFRVQEEKFMRTPKGLLIVFLVFAWVPGGVARAQHEHVMQNEKDVKWIDAPPFIPPGAKLALLQGNPPRRVCFLSA